MRPPPRFSARLVICDLDGVVYRGASAVPGASQLVLALHAAGRLVRFATNNSMFTRAQYVDRLASMGIDTAPEEIVTSTSATVDHLSAHLPTVRRVLALGAAGMLAELRSAGLDATSAADAAQPDWHGEPLAVTYDAVVAGLDPEVDFRRLGIAAAAIRGGARFIATNADVRYPTPQGLVPGAGAIIAALRTTTGVAPLVIGKPEPAMFAAILRRWGIAPADAVVIGDNPDADMLAARGAGIPSILVLTGVTDRAAADALTGDRMPDEIAADPGEVAGVLGIALS